MGIVCLQMIHMKYHTLFFFFKLRKMWQNLWSAAVVIGALRFKENVAQNNGTFNIYVIIEGIKLQ